jgi:hypothetical protein
MASPNCVRSLSPVGPSYVRGTFKRIYLGQVSTFIYMYRKKLEKNLIKANDLTKKDLIGDAMYEYENKI